MIAIPLPSGGNLVVGTFGQPEALSGTSSDDVIMGMDASEILLGGQGSDVMVGGGGVDNFVFERSTAPGQVDVLADFVSGGDLLNFVNISPKEVTTHDTEQGLEIWYGGLGSTNVNHGVVLLWGVHDIAPTDFAFT